MPCSVRVGEELTAPAPCPFGPAPGGPLSALDALQQRLHVALIDPTRIITHTLPPDEAERGFVIFKNEQDDCEKVVLEP